MVRITVLTSSNLTTTRGADSNANDGWDRGDTYTSWSINGIEEARGPYSDLEVAYEVQPGTTYYLLSVIYSTGDSFGHDEASSIEHIGLYQLEAEADMNMRRIEAHNMNNLGPLILTSPSGTQYEIACPWHGYFESLCYVQVTRVSIPITSAIFVMDSPND